MEEKKKKQKLYLETMNKMTDEQSDCNVVRYVVSVQAFTSLQIRVCVQSATAIQWERHSVVARARPDAVCVPIPQWAAGAATSVLRCSTDSTRAWAGEVNHTTRMNTTSAGCTSCEAFIQ